MKRRGFTLIELIISLTLIVSISLITIFNLNNNSSYNDNEKKKKELEFAVDVVSEKLRSDNSLKEFVSEEGTTSEITSYFCLTKETLIGEGLLTEDNEILKGIKDDEYFKVSQDQVGTYLYEHPVKIEDCTYIKSTINNNDFENTEEQVIDNLDAEENGYYLSQHLTATDTADNSYQLKMNFQFNTGKLNNTSFKPNVYTVFVVDGSGSMNKTTEFNKVRDAAINLSKILTETNPSICDTSTSCNFVAAISFDSNVDKNIDFKNTKLLTTDFKRGGGGTNYTNALDAAYKKIVSIDKTKSRFFIVFLSDGVPGDSKTSYNKKVNLIKTFLNPNDSEIEYGKFITVGFKTNLAILSDISSANCKGEGTNCYYTADSSDIGEVFSDFFNIIKKEVMCSTYKKSKISIELTENFKFSDGLQTKVITQNL